MKIGNNEKKYNRPSIISNFENKLARKGMEVNPQYLFFTAYVVFLVCNFLFKLSTMKNFIGLDTSLLAKVSIYPMYLLLAVKIAFYQNYNKKELRVIIVTGVILLISSLLSGVQLLVTAFIFIVAAKDIDIRKLIQITIIIQVICIVIIAILAVSGTIEHRTVVRNDNTMRYSLGFKHPNALASQVLQLITCWVLYRWNNLNYRDYFAMLTLTLVVESLTDSRTSFLLMSLLVILVVFYKFLYNKKILERNTIDNILSVVVKITVIAAPIISIFMGVIYNPNSNILKMINKLFSGRIKLLNDYVLEKGYSIMGQKIEIISTFASKKSEVYNTTALDNAYGHMAVRYGVVVLIIFVLGYYLLVKRASKEKNTPLLIYIFIYFIFGLSEIYIFNLPYNIMLLYLSSVVYNEKSTISIDNDNIYIN